MGRIVTGLAVLLVAMLGWLVWWWLRAGDEGPGVSVAPGEVVAEVERGMAVAAPPPSSRRAEPETSSAVGAVAEVPWAHLTVRVVDARGAVLPGCPVRWRAWTDEAAPADRQDLLTVLTDQAGNAMLALTEAARGRWLSAQVYSVGGNAETPRVSTRALPRDPLVLRLPSTASLTVRVAGPDGGPCPTAGQVRVEWLRAGMVVDAETVAFSAHDAVVRWPRIAADVDVRASATIDPIQFVRASARSSPIRTVPAERRGPLGDGEHVELLLAPPAEQPWLSGRAARSEGGPLANTWLRCALRVDGDDGASEVLTDDRGAFYVPFAAEHSRRTVVSGSFVVLQSASRVAAAVDPRLVLGPGVSDLGTLVFATSDK